MGSEALSGVWRNGKINREGEDPIIYIERSKRISMSAMPKGNLPFLPPEASNRDLIAASAANHIDWFAANAVASGGNVYRENDVTWVVREDNMTIAFPRFSASTASDRLDALVAEGYRRKLMHMSCWSLMPTRPRDLGARVAARGFEWGWKPHWMALDLRQLPSQRPFPEDLEISIEDAADWEVTDLPYYQPDKAHILNALAHSHPRQTWHFAARLRGEIVGHSVLHLTTGPQGVAGIYNVGVVHPARKQGIGSAISLAPCLFARSLGYTYATLNSAADDLYAKIGFRSLGHGQTWWMHAPTLQAPPPTPAQIAFTEAIVRGDISTLDSLPPSLLPDDFNAPLPNCMTPIALAIAADKPASVRWLEAHGATLDLLDAWKLKWRARARRMLIANPDLANRRIGDWNTTPLHEAALRNDLELARLLLTAARPDLTIQDTEFHSTPLGWAYHFHRTEIIALMEEYQKRTK